MKEICAFMLVLFSPNRLPSESTRERMQPDPQKAQCLAATRLPDRQAALRALRLPAK